MCHCHEETDCLKCSISKAFSLRNLNHTLVEFTQSQKSYNFYQEISSQDEIVNTKMKQRIQLLAV